MKFDTKNPRNQKILLTAICVLGATAYYFFSPSFPFTWRSRETQLAELRKQRDDLKAQVAEGKKNANRLEALQQEKEELARRWIELESRLPSEYDAAAFLADITHAGRAVHLEFLSFEPRIPVQQQYYSEAPVAVRVEGSYHRVGAFLAELDNLSRIVRVASLRINTHPRAEEERKDPEVEKPAPPTVTAEVMVSTYFLSSAPATAVSASQSGRGTVTMPALYESQEGEPAVKPGGKEKSG